MRYSLSPKLQRYFLAEGAKVSIHDPYIDSQPLEDTLLNAEILVLGINHDIFKQINFDYLYKLVSRNCLIADIWNILGTGKIIFYLKDVVILHRKDLQKLKVNGEIKKYEKRRNLINNKKMQFSN